MAVKTKRKTIKIVKTTQKQKFKNRERKKQNGENHSVAKFKNREKNNKNVGSRSVAVDNFLIHVLLKSSALSRNLVKQHPLESFPGERF